MSEDDRLARVKAAAWRRIAARRARRGPIAERVALRVLEVVRWDGVGPVPYPGQRQAQSDDGGTS